MTLLSSPLKRGLPRKRGTTAAAGFDRYLDRAGENTDFLVLSTYDGNAQSSRRKSSIELDNEIASVRKSYSGRKSEDDAFSCSSQSAMSEPTYFSPIHGLIYNMEEIKHNEELKVVRHLTRPIRGDTRSLRSRRSKISSRKPRKKRGDSLERDISRTILQTASAGASAAHFLLESRIVEDSNVRSANFILSDLVQQEPMRMKNIAMDKGPVVEKPQEGQSKDDVEGTRNTIDVDGSLSWIINGVPSSLETLTEVESKLEEDIEGTSATIDVDGSLSWMINVLPSPLEVLTEVGSKLEDDIEGTSTTIDVEGSLSWMINGVPSPPKVPTEAEPKLEEHIEGTITTTTTTTTIDADGSLSGIINEAPSPLEALTEVESKREAKAAEQDVAALHRLAATGENLQNEILLAIDAEPIRTDQIVEQASSLHPDPSFGEGGNEEVDSPGDPDPIFAFLDNENDDSDDDDQWTPFGDSPFVYESKKTSVPSSQGSIQARRTPHGLAPAPEAPRSRKDCSPPSKARYAMRPVSPGRNLIQPTSPASVYDFRVNNTFGKESNFNATVLRHGTSQDYPPSNAQSYELGGSGETIEI